MTLVGKTIVSLVVATAVSLPDLALDIPFLDFQGFIDANQGCNSLRTGGKSGLISIKDRITMCPFTNSTNILALTYGHLIIQSLTVVGVRVVDVYGLDLNPTGTAFAEAGFNPSTPEVSPGSNEIFTGLSGADYPATFSTTTTLSNLSGVLTGLGLDPDLTAFSGPSNAIFYVLSADLPAADALTPEPSSLTAMFLAVFAVLVIKRKRCRLRSSEVAAGGS